MIKCLTQPALFTFVLDYAYLKHFAGVLLLNIEGFCRESYMLL